MKNIEELLLKVSEVKTLTESQTNETLKTVLQTEVKSFVKESLDKNDMIEDSDDNMPLDYEEEVVNNEFGDEELSDLLTKLDEEDGDDEMSDDSEETADDTEDKVIDLRGKSKEEIMDFLSSLPDDEVIEFQIEKSEDEDGEEVFDLKSLDDDDELELDIDDQDMDMEDDMDMDDEDMDMDEEAIEPTDEEVKDEEVMEPTEEELSAPRRPMRKGYGMPMKPMREKGMNKPMPKGPMMPRAARPMPGAARPMPKGPMMKKKPMGDAEMSPVKPLTRDELMEKLFGKPKTGGNSPKAPNPSQGKGKK
jgi:hypothetical protein